MKPLSNCNTNALCPNHAQIWSLICIQGCVCKGCASPMWRGGMRKIRTISDFICTRSVLYLRVHRTKSVLYPRVHRTKSVLYRRVHRAYIGLNPYYIAAYIRTISDFLAFLKPLSNCNTNALCLNHVQIWSLICIRGCASPMSVVEENTLQVTPSRAVHVV